MWSKSDGVEVDLEDIHGKNLPRNIPGQSQDIFGQSGVTKNV